MLLSLLLRPSLYSCSVPFKQCARTLQCDAAKMLRSQAERLLQQRLHLRFHTHSRGLKTRNRKTRSQEEEWKTKNKTVLTYIAAAGVGMVGLSYAAVPLYRLYCQVRKHPDTELMFSFPLCPCDPGVCLSGDRAWWRSCGWPRHGYGGDNEAGEGARHQGHLQRRHTRQHPVELQTTTDWDLRKNGFHLSKKKCWRFTLWLLYNNQEENTKAATAMFSFLRWHIFPVVQLVPGETALAFYRAKNPTDKPIIGISTYNVVPFEAGQYFNKIQVENQYFIVSVQVQIHQRPLMDTHETTTFIKPSSRSCVMSRKMKNVN